MAASVADVDPLTKELWARQDQHEGDRWTLFAAVSETIDVQRVLYPGSFVDVSPSFVWPSVTYVDSDRRARRFFDDLDGVIEIIAAHEPKTSHPVVTFVFGDFTDDLGLADGAYDLLISLYAGFVSEHCTRHLRTGGKLLVNPSHGDAAMASIDPRYTLRGVVESRRGRYRVRTDDLDKYLVPKRPVEITPESLHRTRRGVAYTRSPFAYLFERIT
jgi:hypothetical protein